MSEKTIQERIDDDRRDGGSIFSVQDRPLKLSALIEFVQAVFPTHTLDQLAITEADEGQFVVSAAEGTRTIVN